MIGISVTDLSKKLGPNQALKKVSADFSPGLLHGIIGSDGAGKTTLMRVLIGLLRPDEGKITYTESEKPSSLSAIRERMAYMPQQQSLYPDLSVSEHMDFFSDLYRLEESVYRPRREELLRVTRLDRFLDRRAGQLSGGMYKKLGLMCALLQSPAALLLDEPTNGVDPISRREFWDLLYRLSGEKILIIMSTSYMDEAERCSKVHLLESGKMIVSGEPRRVLEKEKAASFDELFLRTYDKDD